MKPCLFAQIETKEAALLDIFSSLPALLLKSLFFLVKNYTFYLFCQINIQELY